MKPSSKIEGRPNKFEPVFRFNYWYFIANIELRRQKQQKTPKLNLSFHFHMFGLNKMWWIFIVVHEYMS